MKKHFLITGAILISFIQSALAANNGALLVTRESNSQSQSIISIDLKKSTGSFLTATYSKGGVKFLDYIDVDVGRSSADGCDLSYTILIIDLSNPDGLRRIKDRLHLKNGETSKVEIQNAGSIVFNLKK